MTYVASLPGEYAAPKQLTLCSNILRNVQVPIAIEGTPILLIGKGTVPLVWLAAPIGMAGQRWVYVVQASRSMNPAVTVRTDLKIGTVVVKVSGSTVISGRAVSPEQITVDKVDLRLLGLAVFGDQSGLTFGGARLQQNIFDNVGTAFAAGSLD